jgi:hypothetical protein
MSTASVGWDSVLMFFGASALSWLGFNADVRVSVSFS